MRQTPTRDGMCGVIVAGLVAVVLAVVFLVAGCRGQDTPTATPTGEALRVADAGTMAGYKREAFGAPWTDDVHVLYGHNRCDTRSDILRRDAVKGTVKPVSGCHVSSGVWVSPYTGERITTTRGVDIDHVVPLAEVWRSGAASWTPERRREYANDPRVLLAVDARSNRSKGDQGPVSWLPARDRCGYVARWVAVKRLYGLSVTAVEQRAIGDVGAHC